jgi:endoglucanase
MDYLLGRNPLDQSFISGFGARPLENPHHRFWAHMLDPHLPGPPPGVVSGGPNNGRPADDIARQIAPSAAAMRCWKDHIFAYSLNEVAINWNAPLVWTAAYLDDTR